MQTPGNQKLSQGYLRNQGLYNRRGYPCCVSSSSLVPSPPCAWNVNSKPQNKAAGKPMQGSRQVGSKWSGQQESTNAAYVLTLHLDVKRLQSVHDLYGKAMAQMCSYMHSEHVVW